MQVLFRTAAQSSCPIIERHHGQQPHQSTAQASKTKPLVTAPPGAPFALKAGFNHDCKLELEFLQPDHVRTATKDT
jgi:hypothetical protein